MSLFQDVLHQIQTQLQKKGLKNKQIAEIISAKIGVPISPEQVTIRNTSIIISTLPTIKVSLRLKEKEILLLLSNEGIRAESIR